MKSLHNLVILKCHMYAVFINNARNSSNCHVGGMPLLFCANMDADIG